MLLFSIATIIPVGLVALATLWGGPFSWMAVAYITLLTFFLDRMVTVRVKRVDPEREFPASDRLLIFLGLAHLELILCALWAVAGDSGLSTLDRGLIAVAAAMVFGQVSHPAAHELIHGADRKMRLLGCLVYSTVLFGHHASAHLRVHHIHVGSRKDPNSARWGEGFYQFSIRAWRDSFTVALSAENKRRAKRFSRLSHPYCLYIGVALIMVAGTWAWLGLAGVGVLVFLAIYTQLQILMSDYVQHYGLRRQPLADGQLEPVAAHHSWNAPDWFSSAMTLNAPRHSDHHVRPARPYPALQLDNQTMPQLPYSLPVMSLIALVPPVWRNMMDPLCAQWTHGWAETAPKSAREIPQAVLARAKPSGVVPGYLPTMDHEDRSDRPRPVTARAAKPAARRDLNDS